MRDATNDAAFHWSRGHCVSGCGPSATEKRTPNSEVASSGWVIPFGTRARRWWVYTQTPEGESWSLWRGIKGRSSSWFTPMQRISFDSIKKLNRTGNQPTPECMIYINSERRGSDIYHGSEIYWTRYSNFPFLCFPSFPLSRWWWWWNLKYNKI